MSFSVQRSAKLTISSSRSNSNIHRVVPPPPPQDVHTRWSLVYFIRPAFDADLYPLVNLSSKIADAAAKHPVMSKMEKGVTAGQWFKRRIINQRAANRKGPETWEQSRGTERESGRAPRRRAVLKLTSCFFVDTPLAA